MNKYFLISFVILFSIHISYAQQPVFQGDLKELLKGPANQSVHDSWLDGMKKWKIDERVKLNYNDSEYLRPSLQWANKCFIYAQMMVEDRYFYDPVLRKYTVDRYLNDLKKRYGGLDAVLIWPTYPNIGIDNRNQFDLLADMPGGLQGVKQMIRDCKKRGVRVFFPIMIWDKGTRQSNQPMPTELIKEMKLIEADGLNGDTMFGVTEDFRNAYDSLGYPLVLQPEVAITDLKMVEWNRMSWGYYWNYDSIPGVSVYKWLEPKHQVQITNRWIIDKTNDLQYAFFNGIGYNAWENIWGVWNQVPERYAEAIRRIATIYRHFPGIWNSAKWEPHIPTLQHGIFASAFPGLNQTVYTLVNRDSIAHTGKQLQLDYQDGMKYFDIWNGNEIIESIQTNKISPQLSIESRGFGAILAIRKEAIDSSFHHFITTMHSLSQKPLNSYSDAWRPLQQHIVAIKKTNPVSTLPAGMVLIPGTKNYNFESIGVMVEGNDLPTAVGVQHPWENHPARSQKHVVEIASFYIDQYPVTNKQFKSFLKASAYHPKDDHNFLKDWHNGMYPDGWDNKPVTWVSIEDARAYAAYEGKRLPNEWEWQYAGQGNDGRLYPWGTTMDSSKIPKPDTSRNRQAPVDVTAFDNGASPYGVRDMVGHVWQWTNEYVDEHTRSAILKGGSYYHPQTSAWYFPQAYELNKYGKYLLMAPGKDRAGTIGFRCVMDK